MIVSYHRSFVYIGPPKTASTTLHKWLTQPALRVRRWCEDDGDQHRSDMPENAKAFFTFASVRNPFDRAVSLWAMSQDEGQRTSFRMPKMEFHEFVKWMARGQRPKFSPQWFYSVSQSSAIGDCRLDAIVRFEDLETVKELPPIAAVKDPLDPIPQLRAKVSHGRVVRRNWKAYYGASDIEADNVRRHFIEDFERFGYSTNIQDYPETENIDADF